MLGSPISRLLILEKFSPGEAHAYSGGRFTSEAFGPLTDIAFTRDPVSGDFYTRPELEPVLLSTLSDVYPSAAPELGELLITRQIGYEVLDSNDLLSWMLRNRGHPIARSSVAAAAAFTPREVEGIFHSLRHLNPGAYQVNMALSSYATAAKRWFDILKPAAASNKDSYGALIALMTYGYPQVKRRTPSAPAPGLSTSDGFVPLAVQQGPKRSGSRNATTLVSQPETTGYFFGQRNLLARPALTNGQRETSEGYQSPFFGLPGVTLSESTVQLLKLVISDRGPSQVNETLELDVDSQLVRREAAIAISDTAMHEGVLFVYLGSLPSSIADALPISVSSLAGDRLIPGGGPVISRYRAEMTAALAKVARYAVDAGGILSASDWSRIDRSVREPWRFVSTSREYVDVSMVEVAWTEPLRPHTASRELWPFNGASKGSVPVEGFRNGSDDSYSVRISLSDMRSLKALELDSIPRPPRFPALTRPSRILAHVQWTTAAYLSLLTLVAVCAAALITLSLAMTNGGVSDFDYSTLSLVVSLASVTTSPFIAYLATVGHRKEAGLLRYRSVLVRAAAVVGITLLFSAASLLSGSHSEIGYAVTGGNIIVAGYLLFSAIISLILRLSSRTTNTRILGSHEEQH
ncbi:hypothetical protein [Micromonospora sp. LH3U1]|uniref:hypothetical protein n=1 Tax=Micromonospora sp. LH3U1 TaxID=3018339 RepID=UPI0023499935|nr:hypothetical protein [Micromonospora sp. LH3U1]WCN80920.1 hypothetical protein PCA76_29210 [Micromonospora sp. LH3U1]